MTDLDWARAVLAASGPVVLSDDGRAVLVASAHSPAREIAALDINEDIECAPTSARAIALVNVLGPLLDVLATLRPEEVRIAYTEPMRYERCRCCSAMSRSVRATESHEPITHTAACVYGRALAALAAERERQR